MCCALGNQRCFMHYYLHQPVNARLHELNTWIQEINTYLTDILPLIFELSSDNLLEILEFAVPNAW
jgi:cell division FtsZ-interacting protein ZapD